MFFSWRRGGGSEAGWCRDHVACLSVDQALLASSPATAGLARLTHTWAGSAFTVHPRDGSAARAGACTWRRNRRAPLARPQLKHVVAGWALDTFDRCMEPCPSLALIAVPLAPPSQRRCSASRPSLHFPPRAPPRRAMATLTKPGPRSPPWFVRETTRTQCGPVTLRRRPCPWPLLEEGQT